MNEKLISRKKFKKGLFVLGGILLATNLAYSAPVTDTVGVEFVIHDNLVVNTSTTNLDFGNVPITQSTITAPTNALLSIEGTNFTAASVSVSVPKDFGLTQGTSSIPFTSTLVGSAGSVTTAGNDLVWTSGTGFTPGNNKFDLEFGGTIDLTGTEAMGDYQKTTTINVAYN